MFEDVIHLSISRMDVDCSELLEMFSYLDASKIPMELFRSRQMLLSELELLKSQSLVTMDDAKGYMTMHPLTQQVI